jgi:hypothetical protein
VLLRRAPAGYRLSGGLLVPAPYVITPRKTAVERAKERWRIQSAIARDASSPADFALATSANDDPTGTSASFTPPLDAIITVAIADDSVSGITPTATVSNTGFSISPAWGSALVNSRGDTEGTAGIVLIYRTLVTASAAGTITVVVNNMGASGTSTRGRAYIDVWTGADTDQTGAAINEGSFTSNAFNGTVITTTRDGSQVLVVYGDWNATGAAAPTTGQQGTGFWISGTYSGIRTYQTSPVASSSTAVLGSFDANGAGDSDVNWCACEILAGAGGGGATVYTRRPLSSPIFQSRVIR